MEKYSTEQCNCIIKTSNYIILTQRAYHWFFDVQNSLNEFEIQGSVSNLPRFGRPRSVRNEATVECKEKCWRPHHINAKAIWTGWGHPDVGPAYPKILVLGFDDYVRDYLLKNCSLVWFSVVFHSILMRLLKFLLLMKTFSVLKQIIYFIFTVTCIFPLAIDKFSIGTLQISNSPMQHL